MGRLFSLMMRFGCGAHMMGHGHDDDLEIAAIMTRAITKWLSDSAPHALTDADPASVEIDGFDCVITPASTTPGLWTMATVELSASGQLIAVAKVELRDRKASVH